MPPSTDDRAARGSAVLLGIAPLALACNGAVDALALGGTTLIALVVAAPAARAFQDAAPIAVRLALPVLAAATVVTAMQMALQAGWPALHAPIAGYFPLAVLAAVSLALAGSGTRGVAGALPALAGLAALFVIGALREALGQGTLFAGAGERLHLPRLEFGPVQRGFPLALLPAGALGLLAAGLALWNRRR